MHLQRIFEGAKSVYPSVISEWSRVFLQRRDHIDFETENQPYLEFIYEAHRAQDQDNVAELQDQAQLLQYFFSKERSSLIFSDAPEVDMVRYLACEGTAADQRCDNALSCRSEKVAHVIEKSFVGRNVFPIKGSDPLDAPELYQAIRMPVRRHPPSSQAALSRDCPANQDSVSSNAARAGQIRKCEPSALTEQGNRCCPTPYSCLHTHKPQGNPSSATS